MSSHTPVLPAPFDLAAAVLEFHRAAGLPCDRPRGVNHDVVESRHAQLFEELEELYLACEYQDVVETADALADILYVLHGTAHAHGVALTPEPAWRCPTSNAAIRSLVFAVDQAAREDDIDGVEAAARCLDFVVRERMRGLGLPVGEILREVHRSNMSKFDEDGRAHYRADGKVTKGPRFSPPRLHELLLAHGVHGA